MFLGGEDVGRFMIFIFGHKKDKFLKPMDEALEELLCKANGFPKNEKYFKGSLSIHSETDEISETRVLEGCYWTEKANVDLESLRLTPESSSLAPTKSKSWKIFYAHPNKSIVGVPKFFGLSAFGKPASDRRRDGNTIKVEWGSKTLREIQQKGVRQTLETLNKWGGAFFIADCGFGKTVCMARLIFELQKKTLVVVPRLTLMDQIIKEFSGSELLRGASVAKLQGREHSLHEDIFVASIDSLAQISYDQEFLNSFGLVVFDEAHHMAASTLSQIMPRIFAKNIVGFSATPDRPDGLEHALYWLMGPVSFVYQRLPSITGVWGAVRVEMVDVFSSIQDQFLPGGSLAYAGMINALVENEDRTQQILSLVKQNLHRRKLLCITSIKRHAEQIFAALEKEVSCQILHGDVKDRTLKDVKVLVATYGLLEEGFDDPTLDTLFLCTPRSRVQQSVGRIERILQGKLCPLVFDFVDSNQVFRAMSRKRQKFYNSRGFTVNSPKQEVEEVSFDDVCEEK